MVGRVAIQRIKRDIAEHTLGKCPALQTDDAAANKPQTLESQDGRALVNFKRVGFVCIGGIAVEVDQTVLDLFAAR